jgi:hypothetical protein
MDLVVQLRTEHGWSWQQIGAELNITKQGAAKVYAEHVKDLVRRKTAADRARFETVRPPAPVASPAVDPVMRARRRSVPHLAMS